MSDSTTNIEFPLKEARTIVRNLAVPKAHLYWLDLFFSVSLGWGGFIFSIVLSIHPILRILLVAISALALYRCAIFIHELAHFRKGTFRLFRIVWNMLCGFPFMLPSFIYKGVHIEHHVQTVYGTKDDGEYWPFIHESRYKIIVFPIVAFLLPLYYAVRFIVFTPLLLLSKKLRNFVWAWNSSLAIIMKYRRPDPTKEERRQWLLQEWMTALYGIAGIVLIVLGILPVAVLLVWYCVTTISFFLNAIRTLVAHSYRNKGESSMAVSDQFMDSVNVIGLSFLPTLWAPVGLRYHATHHLFPSMPYHALGKAHRTLLEKLPESSGYNVVNHRNLWTALSQLWRETKATYSPSV